MPHYEWDCRVSASDPAHSINALEASHAVSRGGTPCFSGSAELHTLYPVFIPSCRRAPRVLPHLAMVRMLLSTSGACVFPDQCLVLWASPSSALWAVCQRSHLVTPVQVSSLRGVWRRLVPSEASLGPYFLLHRHRRDRPPLPFFLHTRQQMWTRLHLALRAARWPWPPPAPPPTVERKCQPLERQRLDWVGQACTPVPRGPGPGSGG